MNSNCRVSTKFIVESHLKKFEKVGSVDNIANENSRETLINDFLDDIMAQFSDVVKENEVLKDSKKYDDKENFVLYEKISKLTNEIQELKCINREQKESMRNNVKENEVVQELQRKLTESNASNKKLAKAIMAVVEVL